MDSAPGFRLVSAVPTVLPKVENSIACLPVEIDGKGIKPPVGPFAS